MRRYSWYCDEETIVGCHVHETNDERCILMLRFDVASTSFVEKRIIPIQVLKRDYTGGSLRMFMLTSTTFVLGNSDGWDICHLTDASSAAKTTLACVQNIMDVAYYGKDTWMIDLHLNLYVFENDGFRLLVDTKPHVQAEDRDDVGRFYFNRITLHVIAGEMIFVGYKTMYYVFTRFGELLQRIPLCSGNNVFTCGTAAIMWNRHEQLLLEYYFVPAAPFTFRMVERPRTRVKSWKNASEGNDVLTITNEADGLRVEFR